MSDLSTRWKTTITVTALIYLACQGALIVWLGQPTNILHQQGLLACASISAGILAGVGIGAVAPSIVDAIRGK